MLKTVKALLLGGAYVAGALAAPAAERLPATPGEINTGLGLSHLSFVLSPNGRWVGFFNGDAGMGFANLETGEFADAGEGQDIEIWEIALQTPLSAWSPDSSRLALYVTRDGKKSLSIAKPGDTAARRLLVVPGNLYTQWMPVWAPDGKTVFVVVNQALPWIKSWASDDNPPWIGKNVQLELTAPYNFDADKLRSRFELEYEGAYAEMVRSFILAVDVASGRASLLAKGNDIESIQISPDGKHLAAVQLKASVPDKESGWSKQIYGDVYVVDIPASLGELKPVNLEKVDDRRAGWSDYKGRRLHPAIADTGLNHTWRDFRPEFSSYGNGGNVPLAWSADSKRFSFATVGREATGDVYLYDLAAKQLRNLTEKFELPKPAKTLGYGENLSQVYKSKRFGGFWAPLWSADGRTIYAVARGEAWAISADGAQAPRLLTQSLPLESVRLVPGGNSEQVYADEQGRLLVIAKDKLSRMDAIWRVDPADGKSELFSDAGVWISIIASTDTAGRHLVYQGQTVESSTNFYRIDLKTPGAPKALTQYATQLAEREYPETRIVQWETSLGVTYGLLYLPKGASAANKVPMVVEGYPGDFQSRLDYRGRAGAGYFQNKVYGLLRSGIAVFLPDLQISDDGEYQKPLKQIGETVIAATQAAIATGVIDPKRLGIAGSSYGGYMAQAVITQTDMFKCAVSYNGDSNYAGNYLSAGSTGPRYFEMGQGRMGGSLWDMPERYLESSPITYLNRIHTPLLLIHGDMDQVVPVEQSWQSFRGLKRLKKPVIFARYPRKSHGSWPEGEQRSISWFREHLLGGKVTANFADQGAFFFGGQQEGDKLTESPDRDKPVVLPKATE